LTPIVNTLGEHALDRIAGAIVHELGDGTGADRADIAGLVADRVEHRLVPVEDLLITRPERQAPEAAPLGPPENRASSM